MDFSIHEEGTSLHPTAKNPNISVIHHQEDIEIMSSDTEFYNDVQLQAAITKASEL